MAKFFVLHLSDLHICDTVTTTLEKLINSISSNAELSDNNLIIAITGDIINRAEYEHFKETVIEFFQSLKNALDSANVHVCDIVIVPGNHDKKTEAANKLYSIAQQSGVAFLDKSKAPAHMPSEQEVIELQLKGFKNYLNLCNKIFEIFELKDESGKLKSYKSSFGVEKISINDSEMIFIRFNTAISCYGCPGDGERYRLTLGQHQLNTLFTQYKKAKRTCKANPITFALAHHPVSYMISKEVAKINKYLISEELLNVDYFLSGHIHDGSLTNLSNHNRSMLSLETGIGWPDDPETTHKDHRYAIYCFDEEKNVFYTSMYKTNQANDFCVDNDHLLTKQEKENGKIYNPLRTRDYAYIALNDFEAADKQYLFVDSDSLHTLKLLFSTIGEFSSFCTKLLPEYLNQYINRLLQDEKTSTQTRNNITDIFNDNLTSIPVSSGSKKGFEPFLESVYTMTTSGREEMLLQTFLSYLQHICDNFYENFKDYFDKNSECRAVFRVYSKAADEYVPICASPPNAIPRSPNVTNPSGSPRVYKYEDSLIKHAFENKKSLVYSINAEKHYFMPDNWDDFIVMVPAIQNYNYRNARGRFDTRPAISFVFSVRLKNPDEYKNDGSYKEKFKKQAHRLYLLQFSEVEKIISSVVSNFLERLPIEIDMFIDWANKTECKGDT